MGVRLQPSLPLIASSRSGTTCGVTFHYRPVMEAADPVSDIPVFRGLSESPILPEYKCLGIANGPFGTKRDTVRIPRDVDQRSELMSITIPK